MNINYEELAEITVTSQEELDSIPENYEGRVYIKFGTHSNRAIVNRSFKMPVIVFDNSSVIARGNSSVVARGHSSVVAWDNSSVVARGNSSVEARDNSSVEAWGNVQIMNNQGTNERISVHGNARIVYNPKTISEYVDFYGIDHDQRRGKFFKAVHKDKNGVYFSDHAKVFTYKIGEKAVADRFDSDCLERCGHGIHMAHLVWVLDYGRYWDDLAILEVEAYLDSTVVPQSACGKVRAPEVMVLREVPLEECGLLGKMIAERRSRSINGV